MNSEAEKLLREKFSLPLKKGQNRHIYFWYDEEESFYEEMKTYEMADVKVMIADENHYFKTKYEIEEIYPEDHILVYLPIGKPTFHDNPLLDILLYSDEIYMDEDANLMEEMDFQSEEMRVLFQENKLFFRSKARRTRFKTYIPHKEETTEKEFKLAMFATLTKSKEPKLMAILIQLFNDWSKESELLWQEIIKYGDVPFFWEQVYFLFGYKKVSPTIEDLCLSIFITKLKVDCLDKVPENWRSNFVALELNTVVFINQWMNQKDQEESYRYVSEKVAVAIRLSDFLKRKSYEFLAQSDLFLSGDIALLKEITKQLCEDGLSYAKYETTLQNRRNTFWYSKLSADYQGLLYATRFFKLLRELEETDYLMGTLETLWDGYQTTYYLLDTYYRKFYYYVGQMETQSELMWQLKAKVEQFYTNGFIGKLSNRWSDLIDDKDLITIDGIEKQSNFFKNHPDKYIQSNQRIFVIISDAMRYEVGVELQEELANSHRFEVVVEEMQGVVPSYTALGMASLLPHDTLKVTSKGDWLIDDVSTQGTQNRQKVLTNYLGDGEATAIQAKNILTMTREELRDFYRGKRLNYIYHNRIDASGDNASTEDNVIGECQAAIDDITQIVQRLYVNLSADNIYITSDHGFLYSREAINETIKVSLPEARSLASNKRFLLTEDHKELLNCQSFQVPETRSDEVIAHIPRADLRFSVQGGGNKFVHGGATIQEMMVPLIKIKTERGNLEQKVEIQLITPIVRFTSVVTNLEFLQVQPVTGERQTRQVRVFVEDEMGERVSNEILLVGDLRSQEARDRVLSDRLVLYSREYLSQEDYFMVLEDVTDKSEREAHLIKIDLPNLEGF